MQSAFEVIADPSRRRLLDLLQDGPAAVGDLVAASGLSQPNTSRHLGVLRRAGLVTAHKVGQRRLYELRVEGFTELALWLTPYVVLRQRALAAPV